MFIKKLSSLPLRLSLILLMAMAFNACEIVEPNNMEPSNSGNKLAMKRQELAFESKPSGLKIDSITGSISFYFAEQMLEQPILINDVHSEALLIDPAMKDSISFISIKVYRHNFLVGEINRFDITNQWEQESLMIPLKWDKIEVDRAMLRDFIPSSLE